MHYWNSFYKGHCTFDCYNRVFLSLNSGVEARKAIAANNGIQATLIAMEIGSQDPEIQSCGLALLACGIIESMFISLYFLPFFYSIKLVSSLVRDTCSLRTKFKSSK